MGFIKDFWDLYWIYMGFIWDLCDLYGIYKGFMGFMGLYGGKYGFIKMNMWLKLWVLIWVIER